MQGRPKPPGPPAFEPIDPPKRQISRQPPAATEPALWGWLIGNRGGGRSCTCKLGSDYELADGGSGRRRSADSTIFTASGSPVSPPVRGSEPSTTSSHFGRTSHAWPSLSYPGRHGPGPDPCRPDGRPGAGSQ